MTASFFGTDASGGLSGPIALKNAQNGIYIRGSASGNTIGGTAPADRNIISKNSNGVLIDSPATSNVVEGNYIGTEADGDNHSIGQQSGNTYGILLVGPANTIQNNLISNNSSAGVVISGSTAHDNFVTNNLIGTKADGTSAMHNGTGVEMTFGATDATVTNNTIAFNSGYGRRSGGPGDSRRHDQELLARNNISR